MSIQSAASKLVAALLESEKVCAYCQKEFGIDAVKGESHGVCVRHAVETLMGAGYSRQDAEETAATAGGSPPDMALSRS